MAKEPEQQIFFGDMPMHELFRKQVQQVIEQVCGTGGMNYTAPIGRKKKPGPAI